ncbi:hypothetical protein ABIC08_008645 [Bradyrhizobium sp. RT9b]|uniref:hypothetical protein n=1 Tax=unclassified Bradyrhizobium TaxID=2631580 RepID=UPI003390C2CD
MLIAQHQKKQRESSNHATFEHNGLSMKRLPTEQVQITVSETGVAAATICNHLNVGNDLLKFRKAELERQSPTTQVFQGDHIDLYIEIAGVAREPVLLRAPGIAALSSCPAGTDVGLIVGSGDVVAFPPEARVA